VIDVLAHDVSNLPLAAGEIITTGTLTRPFPVVAGESWSTVLTGISVDPISVIFA
jgi:2-oxo-3-hexenedioate decarboxylase